MLGFVGTTVYDFLHFGNRKIARAGVAGFNV